MRIAIIGGGQAGRALGRVFRNAGHELTVVTCRNEVRARAAAEFTGALRWSLDPREAGSGADLILLCVPDDAIGAAASTISPEAGAVVAHVSGVHASEILAPHPHRASLHPLRSFADPARSVTEFAGTFCAVEGTLPAVERMEELVRQAGGIPLRVSPEAKAAYHAGAVFASNYVVALVEAGLRLFECAGIPRAEAHRALSSLLTGTARNVESAGVPAALTGPVERGDIETIRRHVEELRKTQPDLSGLYAALARLTCEVALAKGSLDRGTAGRINAVLGNVDSLGVFLAPARRSP